MTCIRCKADHAGPRKTCELCLARQREVQKRIRDRRPGWNAKRQREARQENPERQREYNRRWSEKNPGRRAELARQWRESNPDYAARWHQANRERQAELERLWRAVNREVKNETTRRRRARLKMATIVDFSPAQLAARMEMYARCWRCGTPDWEAVDHVKPLARGGPHMLANLRPICKSCNSRKSATWPITNWKVARPTCRIMTA